MDGTVNFEKVNKKTKKVIWNFSIEGKSHMIELQERMHKGKRKIFIDNVLKILKFTAFLRKDEMYSFELDDVKVEIEIDSRYPFIDTPENDRLKYDCFIDGISLNTGLGPKTEDEKLLAIEMQKKQEWELIYAKGKRSYNLKIIGGNLLAFLNFIGVIVILVLLKIIIKREMDVLSLIGVIIGTLIGFVSVYIYDRSTWRQNNRRYIDSNKLKMDEENKKRLKDKGLNDIKKAN
ncbi:MAG: hypothetical protein WC677_00920 [Clostridia bacterium]|jgi:hypothetical protein